MKRTLLLVLILITITTSVYADTSNWNFEKEILNIDSDGYKEFFIDKDVYRESKENLSDIRIINQEGEFIPYYIASGEDNLNLREKNSYDGQNILNFYKEDNYHMDFKLINDKENKDFLTNKLKFNISSKDNFAKHIKVYGSYDNIEWDYIKNDSIYNISGGSHKVEVKFDDILKYSYYRIIVIDNVEEIQIKDLIAVNVEEDYKKIDYTSSTDIEYEVVSKNKETIVYIKNDDRLRIYKVGVETDDVFHREATIYGENFIVSGMISDKNTSLIVHPNYINDEELRLIIRDNDDKPIDIKNIEVDYFIDKVVFEANKNDKYYLIYGDENASKPSYDIVYKKDDIEDIDSVILSDTFIEQESKEISNIDKKLILNAVIIIISFSLIGIILKNIKRK